MGITGKLRHTLLDKDAKRFHWGQDAHINKWFWKTECQFEK